MIMTVKSRLKEVTKMKANQEAKTSEGKTIPSRVGVNCPEILEDVKCYQCSQIVLMEQRIDKHRQKARTTSSKNLVISRRL